jgi:hypothetical protein
LKRIIDAPDVAPTLFPPPDLVQLLAYVRAVWDELRLQAPTWWSAQRETVLVSGFFEALTNDERLMRHGVGFGHLILEASSVELDTKGMPRIKGRTDIVFAHASYMGPRLVMEFKRLNNGSALRGHYVKEGVRRFVMGQYSPEADLGMMVGLVLGSVATERSALLTHLSKASVVSAMQSKAMSHPAYGDPSQDAPSVDFDTLHGRPSACLASEIRVGHILLER